MDPLVSVIVPTWNRVQYLREALLSVAAQGYGCIEMIVVDDGSTDGTREAVEDVIRETAPARGQDWIDYVFQEHAGVATARNNGLARATGVFIAFCDSDDHWVEDKLEKQVAYLEQHPEARLVFCEYGNYTDIPEDELTESEDRLLHEHATQFHLASALVRKELFDELGPYAEEIRFGEDTEWLIRASFAGVDLKHHIPETLYIRRVHSGNLSLEGTSTANGMLATMAANLRRMRKGGGAR